MIELRPYTEKDAIKIVNWLPDEKAFRLWCADRFDNFPLSPEEFDSIYKSNSNMQGMIAEDNNETVGHFFIQDLNNGGYKFGLIIVDSTKRGMGYGKKMLEAALEYAKNTLKTKSVTLSVFDNNNAAYGCYKKIGFKETGIFKEYTFFGEKHKYFELEYLF